MNCKAKGSRKERRARDILQEKGYQLVVKAGGSLGLFDLVGLGVDFNHVLLVQVKSNRKPSQAELDRIKAFLVPDYCRKQLWIFKDRVKHPDVLDL